MIRSVHVRVGDVDAAADFFAGPLALPVARRPGSAVVGVGTTTLRLSRDDQPGDQQGDQQGDAAPPGVHHLAFEVAVDGFDAHREWLGARVPLLRDATGATEFEGPPAWLSRSVYFAGPDAMVLELICRRRRPQPADATDAPRLLSVSEVGVAVPDVDAAVRALRPSGLLPYGEGSQTFAPVGDDLGLLILVAQDRAWWPALDVRAASLPLAVELVPPGADAAERTIALSSRAMVSLVR